MPDEQKPALVWDDRASLRSSAETPEGHYICLKMAAGWKPAFCGDDVKDFWIPCVDGVTLDEAKAACEKHWQESK